MRTDDQSVQKEKTHKQEEVATFLQAESLKPSRIKWKYKFVKVHNEKNSSFSSPLALKF